MTNHELEDLEVTKVLFIPHNSPSHAMDTLYRGICKILGDNFVLDYPRSEIYHTGERIDPYGWWTYYNNQESPDYDYRTIINLIKEREFSHIICSRFLVQKLRDILGELKDLNDLPTIYILDEGEGVARRQNYKDRWWSLEDLKERIIILKSDLLKNHDYAGFKVKPFHMSCPSKIEQYALKDFDGNEKTYDICFALGMTNPYRALVHWKLKEFQNEFPRLKIINRYGESFNSLEEYFHVLNDSKICISVRGAGWTTTRYVEVPMLKSMLFSERLPLDIPGAFEDRKNAVFFNQNLIDFKTLIRYYIENEEARLNVAKEGYVHAKKYLSTEGMAKYVLSSEGIKGESENNEE